MVNIEEMAMFCKRKGIIYPTAEIYGGLNGFFDYGPLGVEIKNNIKQSFWKTFVHNRNDVVGMDGAIITNPKVWVASGHVGCFEDVLIECTKCKSRHRADIIIEDALDKNVEGLELTEIKNIMDENEISCPKCGNKEYSEPKQFNLMFNTTVGPISDDVAYLRPETAQLIFTDYRLVMENARQKLPFGICQVGKAFRNEISPRDFLFRSREFEQMEIEFFTHPEKYDDCPYVEEIKNFKVNILTAGSDDVQKESTIEMMLENNLLSQWHAFWLAQMYRWFLDLGINPENLRLREHNKDELAHYAKACFDIEYKFPFGWKEIHGNADRKQFDLQQHIKHSKKDLSVYDEESKKKVVPYVASEPSQGVDRAFLAFMFDAYEEKEDEKTGKTVILHLDPRLSAYKIAVLPLVNKEGIPELSKRIFDDLKKEFTCIYDKGGAIGRRYARNDEIATPYCITIDYDSLENKDVTIRDRDTTKQIRVDIEDLKNVVRKLINKEIYFEKAGRLI